MGTTLKAYAEKSGMINSGLMVETYTQAGSAVTPISSPSGGTFSGPQTVTLSSGTAGAKIYYTLDGSDPITNPNNTRIEYTGPFVVQLGTTLKFFAEKAGLVDSVVSTETFLQASGGGMTRAIMPTAEPGEGSFPGPQVVTLSSRTPNAVIYYTLDGSDPREPNSTRKVYTKPITVPMGTTLKAYATRAGKIASAVMTAVYTSNGEEHGASSGCNAGMGLSGLAFLIVGITMRRKKKR